jgi:hypothetical protein
MKTLAMSMMVLALSMYTFECVLQCVLEGYESPHQQTVSQSSHGHSEDSSQGDSPHVCHMDDVNSPSGSSLSFINSESYVIQIELALPQPDFSISSFTKTHIFLIRPPHDPIDQPPKLA